MISILVDNINPRVEYATSLIMRCILHVDIKLIENPELISNVCINYSKHNIPNSFKIEKHTLLDENEIKNYNPQISYWRELPIFFESKQSNKIPFDIFAASFWIATRYEEYNYFNTDKYSVFYAQNSHAYQNNYLQIPIINFWALELKKELQQFFPSLYFPDIKYQLIPGILINNIFKYKNKSLKTNLIKAFKNLVKFKFSDLSSQIKIFRKKENDAWDIYKYIANIHEYFNLNPLFFIAYSNLFNKKSKNLASNSSSLIEILKFLNSKYKIGINLLGSVEQWEKNINLFGKILNKSIDESIISHSKVKLPESYKNIENYCLKFDFSLNYPDLPGYRAGLCTPFFFYNLLEEELTNLSICPLSLTDANLIKHLKLDTEDAKTYINKLVDTIKTCNGIFISLWHNNTFADKPEWNDVYFHLLKTASK